MNVEGLSPRLSSAVAEFSNWWDSLQRELENAQKVRSPLFHYTDAAGLAGIIRNEEIWFTNIFHLNDPSELAYGFDIAVEVLRAEAAAGDGIIRFFCERIEGFLVNHASDIFGYYIACFSRSSDDLSQWRAYADDGRGFALGLAPHLFHPTDGGNNSKPNEMWFISEVIYDKLQAENQQTDVIKRAINIIKREFEASLSRSEDEFFIFLKEMSVAVAAPILWNSITAKHSAYSNEAETRLLITNDLARLAPYIETRTRGSQLIPYIRCPLPIRSARSITEIAIGPSADTEAENAVRSLLLSYGLDKNIPVRRSKIPYRSQV